MDGSTSEQKPSHQSDAALPELLASIEGCNTGGFASNHEADKEKKGRRGEEDDPRRDAFRSSSNSNYELEEFGACSSKGGRS